MKLFFGPESEPRMEVGFKQTSQTIFIAGYQYSAGTLCNNSRFTPEELRKEGYSPFVAHINVPPVMEAIYGNVADGHYYEQTHGGFHGDTREVVVKQANEFLQEKLASFLALQGHYQQLIDRLEPDPHDFISPQYADGYLVHSTLLSDTGDKVRMILTPQQFMNAHQLGYCSNIRDNVNAAGHNIPPFQFIDAQLVNNQTGELRHLEHMTSTGSQRAGYRVGYDYAFKQAMFGMTPSEKQAFQAEHYGIGGVQPPPTKAAYQPNVNARPETPERFAKDKARLEMAGKVTALLEKHGWEMHPNGNVYGLPQKRYMTAVGERIATVLLVETDKLDDGSDDPDYLLKGHYLSEGRNILEPCAFQIPKAFDAAATEKAVEAFAEYADKQQAASYAGRLYADGVRPNPPSEWEIEQRLRTMQAEEDEASQNLSSPSPGM